MMLVNEKTNTLWIAPFVPNNWTQNVMKVTAQNLPTTFGLVSFTVYSHIDKGMIKVIITHPTQSKPDSIIIRLRHPQQRPIQSVTINGDPQTMTVEAHY